jgi:hypothetical protein
VALFWKVLETLGGGAWLEEVGLWGQVLAGGLPVSCSLFPVSHEVSSSALPCAYHMLASSRTAMEAPGHGPTPLTPGARRTLSSLKLPCQVFM